MSKKIVCTLVVAVVLLSMTFAVCACNDNQNGTEDKTTIVYLGDSIAEALIGPSPLGERDNYGYYALVGRCNDFNYFNHSISGHQTSTGFSGDNGLLGLVSKDTEDSTIVKTHIQQADVIHISVLGNNVLQYDLGLMLLEMADPDWYIGNENPIVDQYANGCNFANQDESLFTYLKDGLSKDLAEGKQGKRPSVTLEGNNLVFGAEEDITFYFPPTLSDLSAIVSRLKELNPTAKIIFQKVYNPVYEGTTLLEPAIAEALKRIDAKYADIKEVRALSQSILDILNGFLDTYLESNPGAFTILDMGEVFSEVTAMDTDGDNVDLSADSLGRSLIYADYIHPSNFGHAIIAGATQAILEDFGLAKDGAVDTYKQIKLEQIERMYSVIDGFDTNGAKTAINQATTFDEVSLAYFAAVKGYTPIYA